MFVIRSVVFLTVIASCASLLGQENRKPSQRDPQAIDILTRAVQAAGGSQALARVRDITESGEITFHWGKGIKGPVIIELLGANHFRMESELPDGKSTWVVKDGFGSEKTTEHTVPISHTRAINLENLTFPIRYVQDALADTATQVSLLGIQSREGRSIYRIRLCGQLGLVGEASRNMQIFQVSKDLLIDALTFDVVGIDDDQFLAHSRLGRNAIHHETEFGTFRTEGGIRIPFSIVATTAGQPTLSIRLSIAKFNNNLTVHDFEW